MIDLSFFDKMLVNEHKRATVSSVEHFRIFHIFVTKVGEKQEYLVSTFSIATGQKKAPACKADAMIHI